MDIIAIKADLGGSSGEERGDGGTTAEGREDQFHGVLANPLRAAISHAARCSSLTLWTRGSGGKNVIFSNGPNSTSECSKLLY